MTNKTYDYGADMSAIIRRYGLASLDYVGGEVSFCLGRPLRLEELKGLAADLESTKGALNQ